MGTENHPDWNASWAEMPKLNTPSLRVFVWTEDDDEEPLVLTRYPRGTSEFVITLPKGTRPVTQIRVEFELPGQPSA